MESTQLLWQASDWPSLRYDRGAVADDVGQARRAQGLVEGKLTVLGFDERQSLIVDAWTHDAVSTAAIEGSNSTCWRYALRWLTVWALVLAKALLPRDMSMASWTSWMTL